MPQASAAARRAERSIQVSPRKALRGRVITFGSAADGRSHEMIEYRDGLVVMQRGAVIIVGDYESCCEDVPSGTKVEHYPNGVILPGFIDTQCDLSMMSERLGRPADRVERVIAARLAISELVASGTTTATITAGPDIETANALLEEAGRRGMRVALSVPISGPVEICDADWYDGVIRLVDRWHANGRLQVVFDAPPPAELCARLRRSMSALPRIGANRRLEHTSTISTATDALGRLSIPTAFSHAWTTRVFAGKRDAGVADLLWRATAGGADALGMSDRIGRLRVGGEADIVIVNTLATPLMAAGIARDDSTENTLFETLVCGDDRVVLATFIGGRRAFVREPVSRGEVPPRPVPVPDLHPAG